MDLTLALKAFLRTVERGSVTAAAKELGVSQPAVTKHLRNLEAHIGARLLERSSRLVTLTPHGRTVYEASRPALAAIDAALDGVRREMGAVEGLIRLHAPTCIGAKHLHAMVAAFQGQHPTVSVDLVLEDRVVDLAFENFDLGVRYGRPEGQDVVIRSLGHVRRILVASPAFIARHGTIHTAEQLSACDMVTTAAVLSPRDTLQLQRGHESEEVRVRAILRTNNANVIVEALMSGRVAGPVQHLLVHEELETGALVRLLPEYEVKSHEGFIAYPSARFMRPAVRALTDFIVPRLKAIQGIDPLQRPLVRRDISDAAA